MRVLLTLLCGLFLTSIAPAAAPAASSAPAVSSTGSPSSSTALPGDPARGRLLFAPCRTCHYPEKGFGHHNGPGLYSIFGRQAGTQEGFPYYSEALKRSQLVWSPALLDSWLANPRGFLPGTSMMFVGIPDARDRADLIAYLAQFADH